MSMRKSFTLALVAGFVALLSAGSEPVFAGSSTCPGATCTTPGVDLNVEVVIPAVVRLRIGAAATPTTLTFDMSSTPQLVGDSSPVLATGGDSIIPNQVTVHVLANSGASGVEVAATTDGGGSGIACQGGTGSCDPLNDFINWDQIAVTESGCAGVLPPPLNNAGTGVTNFPAAGGTVNYQCAWGFTYLNTGVPPVDGTYIGTVTYTATGQP